MSDTKEVRRGYLCSLCDLTTIGFELYTELTPSGQRIVDAHDTEAKKYHIKQLDENDQGALGACTFCRSSPVIVYRIEYTTR